MRVLYLDDSTAQLDAVSRALEDEGYEVVTATAVAAAASLVKGCDLVLVDYHLPEVTGETALRVLRRNAPADGRVMFYLYTSDPQVAVTYKALGFDGAFTRKGSLEELVRQVRTTDKLIQMRRFVQSKRP